MNTPLYSLDILRLAASLTRWPPLDAPQGWAECRSATCGSRFAVSVHCDGSGHVTAIGIDAQACALGQASAALCAQGAAGHTLADAKAAARDWADYLAGRRADPGTWPGLDALASARGYPARHASMRLPFDALTQALAAVTTREVKDD